MSHEFQLTRRAFAGSLALSATFAPRCLLGEEARPRLSFVVVSDTHLGYRDQTAAERLWERTATEIANGPGDLVLHLGDVVDGGREPQYAIYNTLKRRLGKPIHEIPGNHDPADLFARHVRETIDTTVDLQWLRFLLVNNARRESHHGFVSDAQLDWLERQCQQAAREDRFVVICMHVPAHANRHPDRGWFVQPADGQTKLYELLERHRAQVLALFHGHFHNGIRGWDDHGPLHEICFPSALYNQNRDLTNQRAPGYNLDEFRPGYTLVTIEQGQLKLQFKVVAQDASAQRALNIRALM